jgi:tetratricopeptide (TPR) repeat protein
MRRIKFWPFFVCSCLILSGCSSNQKKVIDPAAPVSSEQNRSSGSGGVEKSQAKPPSAQLKTAAPDNDQMKLSVDQVAARIAEYNKKAARWKERDNQAVVMRLSTDDSEKMVRCFLELQKILNGYTRLHEILLQQTAVPRGPAKAAINPRELVELQQSDIAFVEGVCGQIVAAADVNGGGMQGGGLDRLDSLESTLAELAAKGRNEELVQAWRQIPEPLADRLSLPARISYGRALMTLRQAEEAEGVFHQILEENTLPDGQTADLLSVRKILADLYVCSGKYKDAEGQYIQISREYKELGGVEEWAVLQLSMLKRGDQGGAELKEYSNLLMNYLAYNPVKDGYTVVWQADKFLKTYPYSPVASNVDRIRTAVRTRADEWSKNVIPGIEKSAGTPPMAQDNSGKAESVPAPMGAGRVETPPLVITTPEARLLPSAEKAGAEVVTAEMTQELEGRWKEGLVLMEGAQYDKAIEKFNSLHGTEYSAKAEKKILEASLLAAEGERRKAAETFIRFTKASDIETKKKLLIESRNRLLDILAKYPMVEIKDKVMGNIKRVEKEMNAIDPNLIRQSGRAGV